MISFTFHLLKSEDDGCFPTHCDGMGEPSPSFIPATCLNISANICTCSVEKYLNSSELVALPLGRLTGSGGGGLCNKLRMKLICAHSYITYIAQKSTARYGTQALVQMVS